MSKITIIKPKKRLFSFADLQEVWRYRELLFIFVKKNIKVKYKQTIIGGAWAVLQPFSTMIVFSFFFGKLAKMPSEGIPYPIFSYSGLILWTYFSNSLASASTSLVGNASLISKIYFPRLLLPLSATLTGILDYAIAGLIVFGLMFYYQISLNWLILLIPFVVLLTWLLASGIGFWLSAINVKYRDVGFIVPFFIQLLMFATPVIYPASVAGQFKLIIGLNPVTGLIEAHRAMILGHQGINFSLLIMSLISALVIFASGLIYFKSVEKRFVDII
jgi:lipopolysaccharide transport system permease protein